ncbi:MAG TPA: hypothetical protein GXZ95_00145 [Mollicutes bacterium]|nr:hypothetical protein [Mollicutes bacterium]
MFKKYDIDKDIFFGYIKIVDKERKKALCEKYADIEVPPKFYPEKYVVRLLLKLSPNDMNNDYDDFIKPIKKPLKLSKNDVEMVQPVGKYIENETRVLTKGRIYALAEKNLNKYKLENKESDLPDCNSWKEKRLIEVSNLYIKR